LAKHKRRPLSCFAVGQLIALLARISFRKCSTERAFNQHVDRHHKIITRSTSYAKHQSRTKERSADLDEKEGDKRLCIGGMKQGKEEKGNNKLVKWFLAFHKQRGNGEEKWEKKHQKTNYKSQRYLKVNQ